MDRLEDTYLTSLFKEKQLISIYLVNGIRLSGYLMAFDTSTLVLANHLTSHNYQLVYKQAIATVQPTVNPTRQKEHSHATWVTK